MSSRNPNSRLVVARHSISDRDKKAIRTGYFREARANVFATFMIVAVMMSGLAFVVFKLFWPFRFDSVAAFGIGSIVGALATVVLLMVGFRDYFEVRADLLAGEYEIVTVTPSRALRVSVNDKVSAVALDCGDYTLLLLGNWWEQVNRRELWRNARERSLFPTAHFVLYRLPRSGRVFGVEVDGGKLEVREGDPLEPLLRVNIPLFMEAYYITDRIDNVLNPVQK